MLHIGFEMNPGIVQDVEFFDDFNRANGGLGPNWVGSGTSILDQHVDMAAGLRYAIFQAELASIDMWAEADITGTSSHDPGVTVRNQSGVNFDPCYFFRYSAGDASGWQLMRVGDVSDTSTYIHLAGAAAAFPGNPYRIRLEVTGTNPVQLRGYRMAAGDVNGAKTLVISYNHSSGTRVTTGQRGGFRNRVSDGTIDNFAVGVID